MTANLVLLCGECGALKPEGGEFCPCGGNYFVESFEEDAKVVADGATPAGPPALPARDDPAPVSSAARPLQLTVTLVLEDGRTVRHDVAAGGHVALGRDPEVGPFAEILETDDLVGRLHAIIEYRADGQAHIRDMYSKNGTIVNGKELRYGEERALADKDQIRIGDTAIVWVRVVPVPPRDQAAGNGEARDGATGAGEGS